MPEPEKPIESYFPYVCHHLKTGSYALSSRFFAFLARRLFARIDVYGLDALVEQRCREEAEGGAAVTIYIARHLSEFDWQEIQRALAGRGLMACVQAGDNLFIGPLGPVLRHLGAFKVFREETVVYAPTWVANACRACCALLLRRPGLRRAARLLGIRPPEPQLIDQVRAKEIYTAYLKHLIDVEGRDILMFPEYSKTEDKKTKYGRSYSGRLLEFTPLIFRLLREINKTTGRRIQLVPVNVSYERIVEDQTFRKLEKMKSSRVQKPFTYLVDYFFNYTHWIYQRKKGTIAICFGQPVELRKKISIGYKLQEEMRKRVGALQMIFPTQVFASAFAQDTSLPEEELLERVDKIMTALRRAGADLRYVAGFSAREIVDQAHALFDQHRKRRIVRKRQRSGTYEVLRPDVLGQYRNHIAHLLEKHPLRDQLIKILDFFR